MGYLIEGEWHDQWRNKQTEAKDGSFVRPDAKIRNWVTPTGQQIGLPQDPTNIANGNVTMSGAGGDSTPAPRRSLRRR